MHPYTGFLLAALGLCAGCWNGATPADAAMDTGGGSDSATDADLPDVPGVDTNIPPTPYAAGVGYPFDVDPLRLDDANIAGVDPASIPELATRHCMAPVLVTVTRIVDGDTVFVNAPGLAERVRIIGINTPELAHDGMLEQCYGAEARDFTSALQGRQVWLTFGAECRDTFDRLLAHVWVGNGEQDHWGRQVLRRGYGQTLTIAPNTSMVDILSADQFEAVSAGRGMWGACP